MKNFEQPKLVQHIFESNSSRLIFHLEIPVDSIKIARIAWCDGPKENSLCWQDRWRQDKSRPQFTTLLGIEIQENSIELSILQYESIDIDAESTLSTN